MLLIVLFLSWYVSLATDILTSPSLYCFPSTILYMINTSHVMYPATSVTVICLIFTSYSSLITVISYCSVVYLVHQLRVRHLYSRKYGAESGRFVRGGQSHCIVSSKSPDPSTKPCHDVLASVFDAKQFEEFASVLQQVGAVGGTSTPSSTVSQSQLQGNKSQSWHDDYPWHDDYAWHDDYVAWFRFAVYFGVTSR